MAEAVLSAFLQVLFENLATPILGEFGFVLGVEQELKRLSRTLLRIRSVLHDAEERQVKEEAVKIWLRDLKDVAYDVDDVLDEFATHVLRFKSEGGSQTDKNQVRSFFSSFSSNQFVFQVEISSKIKEIMKKLDEIHKESSYLCLREGIGRNTKGNGTSERHQTSSLIDESLVFGREEDKKKMIELVLSENGRGYKDFSVIPIVGMGGVGKTTLAQLIYNDELVKKHFELRMWVFVSDDFDVRRLTRSIIESATRKTIELMDLDPLQVTLKEILSAKRFLLVLDDVWNERFSDWDVLQAPFRAGANGSKILVTTRSEIVSSIMGTVPPHCLEGLSDYHCWSLFAERAFVDGNFDLHPNLMRIGKEIVKKCHGLPLAAKTLGGLLNSKTNENEWEVILNSKIWDLPEGQNDIFPALKLSYHHLPVNLKRCFVYCSIFPKDHIFDKDKLVLLWMAEGFIQFDRRKRMEDTASDYFDDLVSRSFFQYSYNHQKKQSIYTMHDLLHDLAQSIAGDECFRMEENKPYNISRRTRYSSLFCDNISPMMMEAFYKCQSLRTFLLLRENPTNLEQIAPTLFSKVGALRVLDLSNSRITELPSSVENLKHLRYLDLSRSRIKRLPESMVRLYNLQTLKLRDCYELLELPKGTMKLVSLRHLEIDTYSRLTSMPPKMGNLTTLQTLSTFTVGKEAGCGIEELKYMMNLRGSLSIMKLESVIDADGANEAELTNKRYLDKLELIWSRGEVTNLRDEIVEEVLKGLQPHTNLKELCIRDYCGIRFPCWIWDSSVLPNLLSVRLLYCRKCEFLPPLGQLPLLKDLYIGAMNTVKHVGHEFVGDGQTLGFPSLETLTFTSMPNFEEWTGVKEGEFPCLSEIIISLCPKLRVLPYLPPTLLSLKIWNCRGLKTLPKLPLIRNLGLQRCDKTLLGSLPYLSTLTSLTLSFFPNLVSIPQDILLPLTALKELEVSCCGELKCLSQEGLLYLESLEHLEISDCPKLSYLTEEGLPISLKHIEISLCPSVVSLPKGLGSLNCLQDLEIRECEQLESLPDGMKNLACLQLLEIWSCPRISYLPADGLPITLQHLSINDSPLLEKRCQNKDGEDWDKIAHIPTVLINGKRLLAVRPQNISSEGT